MGVLTDYFRATDAETVVRAVEGDVVGPAARAGAVFDGFELKGVDPAVGFGQLVAIALGVPWTPTVAGARLVWPADGSADTDAWVFELGERALAAVAGVPDSAVAEVAAEWARAEEWDGASVEEVREIAEGLIGVARRARDAGERLYCWCAL
ncbi:hypothetical protein [Actinosynnema sp. NPDC023587]|uniref:hypothetical protein n=1 Tax=Actinosynnema sp. NPDC023587 TaxID=3154695 RepID=UPI0034078A0B